MKNFLEDSDDRRVVLIIGGGWYGCVMAHQLKLMYPETRVIILEKNSELFTGTSGRFGFRAHRGEHYPRSFLTRFLIYIAMLLFSKHYSELMNKDHSIYALANTEKVSKEEFIAVSNENRNTLGFEPEGGKVHIGGREYCNINYAVENDEPSLAMGERLREWFKSKLHDVGVEIYCNFEVKSIEKQEDGKFLVTSEQEESFFSNHVINATGYQALLTENLESAQASVSKDSTNPDVGSSQAKAHISEHPQNSLFFNTEISYQACLAFVYKYRSSSAKLPPPQSLMFMDGNLPSLTRYDIRVDEKEPFSTYVLTHVTHSVVGAYAKPEQANERLSTVDSDFINERREKAEAEIQKYYPAFGEEFEYVTCESTVFARTVTPEAFRGAFVIQDPNDVIVTFPGKISQTLLLVEEAKLLMENDSNKIRVINGFSYVKGGTLDLAIEHGVFTLPVPVAQKESPNKFLAALKESPHKCFDPIKENPDKFLAALEESPRRFFALLKESHHTLEENKLKTSQRVSGVSAKKKRKLGDTRKNPADFFKKFIPSSSANRENTINPNLDKLDTSRAALS